MHEVLKAQYASCSLHTTNNREFWTLLTILMDTLRTTDSTLHAKTPTTKLKLCWLHDSEVQPFFPPLRQTSTATSTTQAFSTTADDCSSREVYKSPKR